jgi:hypothetical protein
MLTELEASTWEKQTAKQNKHVTSLFRLLLDSDVVCDLAQVMDISILCDQEQIVHWG